MFNGQVINELIEKNKAKKVDVYTYAEISKAALDNLIKGANLPNCKTLERIADFFGVSMDVFFNREKPYQTFSTNDLNNLQLFKDKIELLEKLLEEKDKRIALLENLSQALSKK